MSSQRDPHVFLWDARQAAASVQRFARGKRLDDLLTDELLRSAVERQLQIVGKALSQLSRADPERAAQVPRVRQIVTFRNILVHGYAAVDYPTVWRIIERDLPDLIASLDQLLE